MGVAINPCKLYVGGGAVGRETGTTHHFWVSLMDNQSFRFYLELLILIPMSTNNSSQKSVVLESSTKPSLGCKVGSQALVWQKIQEPLTQDKYTLQQLKRNRQNQRTSVKLS